MIQQSIPEERRANAITQPVVLYSSLFRASSSAADRCSSFVCVPPLPVHFHHRRLNSDRVPLTSALSVACFPSTCCGINIPLISRSLVRRLNIHSVLTALHDSFGFICVLLYVDVLFCQSATYYTNILFLNLCNIIIN